MDKPFFDKAQKIWKKIAHKESEQSHSLELEVHKKLLNMFQVGDYYYFFFNVHRAEFEFISPEIKKLLGYDPENVTAQFFLENIHPDDQPYFLRFEHALHDFFAKLSIDKFTKYKVRYDFRIRKSNGTYIRLLHQLVVVQFDDNGHIFRSLGIHTDISHLKTDGIPVLSFIGLDGEPSFIDTEAKTMLLPGKSLLSKREKEIFKHLAEGKTSKDIADILHISKNTVNTHRKNMLLKTETHSVLEMIVSGIKKGLV